MTAADLEAGLEAQRAQALEDERQRRRALFALLALVLLILLTFGCWAWSQVRDIPDVVGMTEADARAVLEDAGFEVMATQADDAPAARGELTPGESGGEVLAQSPRGGTRYILGTIVTITVDGANVAANDTSDGDGPSMTTLPDVGETGSGAAEDDSRAVWSSSGSGSPGPLVPIAQNMTETAARSVLEGAGYRMVVGGYGPTTAGMTAGKVYFQNPAPGTVLARGATVTVWVSTGAPHQDGYEGMPYPGPTNP